MRTDRTTLCVPCAVRLAATDRCPRCGGVQVFDLTRGSARQKGLRHLAEHHGGGPRGGQMTVLEWLGTIYVKYGLVLFTLGAAVYAWHMGASLLTAAVVAIAALWGAVALFFVAAGVLYLIDASVRLLVGLLGLVVRLFRPKTRKYPRILAADEQDLSAVATLSEVRGTVRGLAPFRSPLSHHECVAVRIAGEGPFGEVDDAAGAPFEIVDGKGETVRVDMSRASVALEVEDRPKAVRPDRELHRFLEARGIYPDRGSVRLAEVLLKEGDEVIVEGVCETSTEADGYRDTKTLRTVRERPGAPMVIRRVTRLGSAP